VAAIIAESFRMQLGGARGAAGDWAVCLAARGDASTNLRSQIGNALALKARAAGLRPVGAVIYIEVLPCYNSKTPTKLLFTRCWRAAACGSHHLHCGTYPMKPSTPNKLCLFLAGCGLEVLPCGVLPCLPLLAADCCRLLLSRHAVFDSAFCEAAPPLRFNPLPLPWSLPAGSGKQ